MKLLFSFPKHIQLDEKSVPWALLAACILAFGLLTPQLGYYQDDWNVVYYHYRYGAPGILELMQYDGRPFASWIYLLGFAILGYKPLAWQIAALLMRWLSVVMVWSIFRAVWPKAGWKNFTAALLFALYPFFVLQPLATTFIHHWTGYFLFGLSIFFMLQSLKKHYWPYTILAIATQFLHLFTLEFYSGIDLLRPVLIWIALGASRTDTSREKLKASLRVWLPYLLMFILYFIWRGFLYHAAAEGRNEPVGLTALLQDPITTILSTVLTALPDLVLVVVSSWGKILDPSTLALQVSINRIALLVGLVGGWGLFWFFSNQNAWKAEEIQDAAASSRQMLAVGGMALLLGLLPVYAAGYEIHTKLPPWNSRFSLGLLFGAALFITALLDLIVKGPRTRWVIISILAGLLFGWHLRSTNDFRWAWDKQVNFYRQLSLRAPSIQPGTAILSEDEFLMFMGTYPISFGINAIYSRPGEMGSKEMDLWYLPLVEFYKNLEAHLNGEPFSDRRASVTFQGEPGGSIVISFDPGMNQCLWVMRPEYAQAKLLSPTLRQLSTLSHVERIAQTPASDENFLSKYLYPRPEQDWCYYYTKADLAAQYQQWEEVTRLWEQAGQAGLQPGHGFEYLPFIEAYAHQGEWETAREMTVTAQKTVQGIQPLLCTVWERIQATTPTSTNRKETLQTVWERLKCSQADK
ncbi:MAG: hypothetical protein Fur0043_22950 [Anaerolineales bacterium]